VKSASKAPLFTGQTGQPMSATLPPVIRVLFVEDSELDYELMLATLARDGVALEGKRVEEADSMRQALATGSWDAVISDQYLPNFSLLGALNVLRESGRDLPFVVVSAELGEEAAVEAMLAGADDYIIKKGLRRLAPALRRSLQSAAARRERAAATEALKLSEARLHELAGHLEAVKETERATVAAEISEELGSSLTALKFELAWLQRHATLLPEETERLSGAIRLVEHTAITAQHVAGSLRPAVLDLGIVPALEWLTSQFAQLSGIETRFDANREETPDPDISTGIYRICQEALGNIARHAGAARVDVHLFADEIQIHLEVTDNGRGWDQTAVDSQSFGLDSMRQRARSLRGTLDISSTPGQGTTVLLSLPRTLERTRSPR
jgi:signal transduction histidine kinase